VEAVGSFLGEAAHGPATDEDERARRVRRRGAERAVLDGERKGGRRIRYGKETPWRASSSGNERYGFADRQESRAYTRIHACAEEDKISSPSPQIFGGPYVRSAWDRSLTGPELREGERPSETTTCSGREIRPGWQGTGASAVEIRGYAGAGADADQPEDEILG